MYIHQLWYYKIILLSISLSTTCWPLESSLKTPTLTHTVYTGSSPLICVFLLAFPNAGLHSYIRWTSCFHSCCRRATSLHFTLRKEWSSQAAPRNNCLNIIIHHHIGPHIQTPSPTCNITGGPHRVCPHWRVPVFLCAVGWGMNPAKSFLLPHSFSVICKSLSKCSAQHFPHQNAPTTT